MVVEDAWLFVTNPDQSVTRIDRETGKIAGTVETGEDTVLSLPQLHGAHLVVTATHITTGINEQTPQTPATLLIVDAGSLEVDHQIQLDDLRGLAVLTDDAIYIPLAPDTGASAQVHRINPETGEIEGPLGGVSAMMIMHLSVSGNTLMATGDPSAIGFYDLTTGEFLGSIDVGIIDPDSQVNNPTIGFNRPVQVWDGQPFVITPLGDVYVVTDEPVATPAATPAAGVNRPGLASRFRAGRTPGTGWSGTSASPSGRAGR